MQLQKGSLKEEYRGPVSPINVEKKSRSVCSRYVESYFILKALLRAH